MKAKIRPFTFHYSAALMADNLMVLAQIEDLAMAKIKKKLTTAQKLAKKKAKAERQKKYMWVFMNGKQVRVKRPETIDGIDVDEFIENNADPVWLHQNELWEYIKDD